MNLPDFNQEQRKVVDFPLTSSVFVEGGAGTGKTSAALGRLNRMLIEYPGQNILVLAPQQSLLKPFREFLSKQEKFSGGLPNLTTISGLAVSMIENFWPIIWKSAGFHNPAELPHFLSNETAQYCMQQVAEPYLQKGYFQALTIEKSRLFSQLLDSLNKSSLVPFPGNQIADRLKNVSDLDPAILNSYDQAQEVILDFRDYCLKNTLVDFSLSLEILKNNIWTLDQCRDHFFGSFKCLIADNIEEDIPVSHDLVNEWMDRLESVTLVLDSGGGFRSFLGADPDSAQKLKEKCQQQFVFDHAILSSHQILEFKEAMDSCITHTKSRVDAESIDSVFEIRNYRFFPEMITDICQESDTLIRSGEAGAGDIVILSPFISDALKFTINHRMKELKIPVAAFRPSRMYIDNPIVRALITFAKVAHPGWSLAATRLQIRHALMAVINELDIVRADLLVKTLARKSGGKIKLGSFDLITNTATQERISFIIGEKFERIRFWLEDYISLDSQPLDIFISRFYGEVVSQPEFSLFGDFESADTAFRITASIRQFRRFAGEFLGLDHISSGREYIRMLEEGLLPAAIRVPELTGEFVSILPAHAFLMENRQCKYQFWLDVGSMGWWERLNQPLTNPYVLRRGWTGDRKWTAADEISANQESMLKIVRGLISRCSGKIIAASVHVNEYGSEQRGPLLQSLQTLQKRMFISGRENGV